MAKEVLRAFDTDRICVQIRHALIFRDLNVPQMPKVEYHPAGGIISINALVFIELRRRSKRDKFVLGFNVGRERYVEHGVFEDFDETVIAAVAMYCVLKETGNVPN
jgi:hypothetical protein